MTTRADILITSDLAALADDSRRALGVDPDELPAGAGAYRDDRIGAAMRRDALLDQRRRELAMMPLELSQVFVHRVQRAAAGATGVIGVAVLAVVLADPLLTQLAAAVVPGLDVLLCIAILGAVVLKAYIVSGWIAERVFARRMQTEITASAGGDAYADLDKLGDGPVVAGRRLVRAVDRWSLVLAVAGFTAVVPFIAYVVFAVGSTHSFSVAWSRVEPLMSPQVTAGIGGMVLAIAAGVVAAIALGRACERENQRGVLPDWASVLGHWMLIPIGGIAGLIGLYAAMRVVHTFQFLGVEPSSAWMLGIAFVGVASAFVQAACALLWWRRREHARLGM